MFTEWINAILVYKYSGAGRGGVTEEEVINFVLTGGLGKFRLFILNYMRFHVCLLYTVLNFHFNSHFHFLHETLPR